MQIQNILLRVILVLVLAIGLTAMSTGVQAQTVDPGADTAVSAETGAVDTASAAEREFQGPAPGPSYPEWEKLARRAEISLEEGRASNAALEQLRSDLVDWRTTFLTAQNANQTRITTLKAQISAIGPVPENGATEPVELTARRAELSAQLQRVEAPRRTADEAYSRADNLIKEIDGMIRDRQASELLQLGPSPLNPANWPEAMGAITGTVRDIARESARAWSNPIQLAETRENLPATLLYLFIALICLFKGRSWVERLEARLGQGVSVQTRNVLGFVLSIGQIVIPVFGIYALTRAFGSSNLVGFRGEVILDSLPLFGFAVFGARWLASQIFPKGERGNAVLALPPERRAEGRFFSTFLGFGLWAISLIRDLSAFESYSDATRTVLLFPVLVFVGVCLVRLGQLISYRRGGEENTAATSYFRRRMARVVGRGTIVLGFAGPIVAAIGYQNAASFLVLPASISLGLLALLVLLQSFATSVYALVTRTESNKMDEALVPVLIGLMLAILSIPVFALIWGARVTDLTEIWTKFREGFTFGETRISPTQFLTFVVIFAVGYGITRLLQGTLKTSILPKTKIDRGGRNAITSGLGYVGILLSAVFAITATGVNLSSLAILFGALSVGIGFGLQNIVSNFVSGIILLIERPISEGDWIEVGGKMGIVRDISVRSTRIETFDRTDVIVPNADFISGTVTNWTRGNLTGRVIVPVGVAYGSDTKKVEAVLREIAEAHPLVSMNPPPNVFFQGFGADSMDFDIRAILRDVNFITQVKSDMNHEISRRFKEEGIEVPFAQRDIFIKNPEALRPVTPEPPQPAEMAAAKPARRTTPVKKAEQ